MLKYKINIKNTKSEIINVDYEFLYFSPDCSWVSGITDSSYGLELLKEITLVSNGTQVCDLSAKTVSYGGYVIFNQPFKVIKNNYSAAILYIDGQYYCTDSKFNENNNPIIEINKQSYEIGKLIDNGVYEWYDYITIPTKYNVFDNKIIINNITYDVIIDNKQVIGDNSTYNPHIILNDYTIDDKDRTLYIHDWEYTKRKKKTIFKITTKFNEALDIVSIERFGVQNYFYYRTHGGDLIRKDSQHLDSDEDKLFWNFFNESKTNMNYIYIPKYDGVFLSLNLMTPLTSWGENMVLQIFSKNNFKIKLTPKIEINDNGDEKYYFTYKNQIYYLEDNKEIKYLFINNKKYEIYEYINKDKTTYYITFNNKPSEVILDDNTKQLYFVNDKNKQGFDYFVEHTININGEKYPFSGFDENDLKNCYVEIIDNISCEVNGVELLNNKTIRCFFGTIIKDYPNLINDIKNNLNNFIFILYRPIFSSSFVEIITQAEKEYVGSNITLLIENNNLTIPIILTNKEGTNINKDYLIENSLIPEIKEPLINRIVDMEKDVYYPSCYEKIGNDEFFTLCKEIKIDLHFRTRNLKTWLVNDNPYSDNYDMTLDNNWNIFDSYRYIGDDDMKKMNLPTLQLKDDLQYYPPSDLLYFLNFTNEDVFYQKQKLGKSFLRLLFYDSKDVATQNLLYMSTVFISETELYNKYVKNIQNNDTFVSIKNLNIKTEKHDINGNKIIEYQSNNNNLTNKIGVDTEPCYNNKKNTLSFDESKRLSSSFVIKNRYNSVDSSDGYHLYLFKEYSNWTHERSIYLKVEFNHAGFGKKINFMLLYHKNQNGEKSMINWNSKYNIDKYKEGCPLKEFYEHIFIEIKVKYDLKNKRFCYYLPQWMTEKNNDKTTMHISLFETKIKDESN